MERHHTGQAEHCPEPRLVPAAGAGWPLGDPGASARVRARPRRRCHRCADRRADDRAGPDARRSGGQRIRARCGVAAVARTSAGRRLRIGVARRAGRAPGRGAATGRAGADRSADGARRACPVGAGAGTAGPGAAVRRAGSRTPDARALPGRAAGRRARRVPHAALRVGREPGHRPQPGGARPRGLDPAPGTRAGRSPRPAAPGGPGWG